MPNSPSEQKKLETLAGVLLESAKAQGHEISDKEILNTLASLPNEMQDLLQVLGESGELTELKGVAQAYTELSDKNEDVCVANITTAVPLNDDLRIKIKEMLESKLEKSVFLVEEVDPSIIGGIVIQSGDQRRDMSVVTQLGKIRDAMDDVLQAGGDI